MADAESIVIPSPLPLGLTDPSAYIHSPQFDLSATFRPTHAPTETHSVSYAIAGSSSKDAPLVLWMNGMGSHRFSCLFPAGPAEQLGLRVLVFDRPGTGKSTPCPLKFRFQTTYDALQAVLEKEGVTEFGLTSHSNVSESDLATLASHAHLNSISQGLLYSIYCLPRLAQAGVKVNAWVISSAWVPPWLSGSLLLSIGRRIPGALTAKLGTVAGALEASFGPIGGAFGWSSGIARDAVSFSGGLLGASAESDASLARRGKLSPEQQFILDEKKDRQKPPHKQRYCRRFYSQKTVDVGMEVVFAEGLDSMGSEALVCLAKGDGAEWGWGHEEDGSVDPKRQYERGFEGLKKVWGDNPRLAPRSIQVWYGEKDLLVPRQGRNYLRSLVVDKLELVESEDWHEVEDAGHDDVLGLTVFAETGFNLFKEAASAGVGGQ